MGKANFDCARTIAIEFFRWWVNTSRTDIEHGFRDWWEINKDRFGS